MPKLPDTVTGARVLGNRMMTLHRRENPDGRMPLMDHLRELRSRVIKAVLLNSADKTPGWDNGQSLQRFNGTTLLRTTQGLDYTVGAGRMNLTRAWDQFTAATTDWDQILALYDQQLAVAPTPVVALNRAVALAEVKGPAAALAEVDRLDLGAYHPFHATRADLLSRLGRHAEAAAAYDAAAALATNAAERAFLEHRAAVARSRTG